MRCVVCAYAIVYMCEWVFHHSLLPDVTLDLYSIRRCRGIGVYEFAIVVQMRKKGGSTLLATMIVDVNDSPQQCKNFQKLLPILYRLSFHDGSSTFSRIIIMLRFAQFNIYLFPPFSPAIRDFERYLFRRTTQIQSHILCHFITHCANGKNGIEQWKCIGRTNHYILFSQ